MTFNTTKYTRWYYAIINAARLRPIEGYSERHHIIPKSLGGSDSNDNLIRLTAREHFICHWLLTKMVEGKERVSMAYALMKMCNQSNHQQQRYTIPSRTYESLKVKMASIMSERDFTPEWRNKLSVAAKNRGLKESNIRSARMKEQHSLGMFKKNKRHSGSDNTFAKVETKEKIKQSNLLKYGVVNPALLPYKCEHCGNAGTGLAGYKRWHGDNCRAKSTK